LKNFAVAVFLSICAFQARTSPLAFIALNPSALSTGKLPSAWQIKVNHGKPDVTPCSDVGQPCVRLKSLKSSFGLERGVDIDPAQMPFLAWRWKVTQLPPAGDFREAAKDDQAAQVLVAFADRRVLTYIWDSTAPRETAQKASAIPLVHIFAVVCRSGAAETNRWIDEARNVAADYQRAFGKAAPHVTGLRLQINSQHTGSTAESYFGEVEFRGTPQ
jgi:hypothetical protein